MMCARLPILIVFTMAPCQAGASDANKSAAELLALLDKRLNSLDSIRFEVEQREPYAPGPQLAKVVMAKEERFRIESVDESGIVTEVVSSDGRFITELSTISEHADGHPAWTRYSVTLAPNKNVPRVRLVKGSALWGHAECWLGDNSPLVAHYRNAIQNASEAEGGRVTIERTTREELPVWHLALTGKMREGLVVITVYYDTYFSADTLLPVFVRHDARGKFLFFGSEPSISETIYRNVQINSMLPDSTFEFTPPADAVFIDPEDDRLRRSFPIGREAPPLELATFQGDKLRLSDLRGNRVVLMSFWSTWCAPCLREMPTLIKLHEEFDGKGLAVIGVSLGDELTRVKSFVEARRVPYTVVHDADQKAGDAFMVHGIPCTILIDKQGIVRRVWNGWSGEEEEKEIREALAEAGVGQR